MAQNYTTSEENLHVSENGSGFRDAEALCTVLVERLNGKPNSQGWACHCPSHDDQRASLSIKISSNQGCDRVLMYCHAGCHINDILAELKMTKGDLHFSSLDHQNRPAQSRITDYYDYHNIEGSVVYRVVRVKEPKGFFQQRPDGLGGWINDMEGVQRVLYQLGRTVEAISQGECIYIVEGEKDANSLLKLGIVSTTNTGGAGKWRDSYTEALKGSHAVILLDNDGPGRKHAYGVAKELKGVASTVKVLELPGLHKKGDVTDWLAAGGTRDALEKLVAGTPEWELADVTTDDGPHTWEPPILLHENKLPPFPTDIFPDWLRLFVEALATATQTLPDLAGLLVIAICAAACAKIVAVLVSPGYIEPVNVFVNITLPSGNRKSAVFSATTAPMRNYERHERERLAPSIAEAESIYRIKSQELKKAENNAAHKDNPEERKAYRTEAEQLARELSELDVPCYTRVLTEDTTAESLGTLLYKQRGRIAVMSAEGGDVFDRMAGRYSSSGASNFGVYLKGHTGDDLWVDRVNRESEYVASPALTMALTVQPDVLHGLLKKADFRGRGLLGRFLHALPQSLLGHRKSNAPSIPEDVGQAYENNVLKLVERPFGKDKDGNPATQLIALSKDAQDLLHQFDRWVEPQLDPLGQLGHMTDWSGKLVGAVARIAGILHMADHVETTEPWKTEMSGQVMTRAIRLGHYLIHHACAAYDEMGADPVVADAKHLLAWIGREAWTSFTKRDLFEKTKGRFKRVENMDPALRLLADHGFIREQPPKDRTGPGRKPSPTYEVNPLFGSHNSKNQKDGVHPTTVGDRLETSNVHKHVAGEEVF